MFIQHAHFLLSLLCDLSDSVESVYAHAQV